MRYMDAKVTGKRPSVGRGAAVAVRDHLSFVRSYLTHTRNYISTQQVQVRTNLIHPC